MNNWLLLCKLFNESNSLFNEFIRSKGQRSRGNICFTGVFLHQRFGANPMWAVALLLAGLFLITIVKKLYWIWTVNKLFGSESNEISIQNMNSQLGIFLYLIYSATYLFVTFAVLSHRSTRLDLFTGAIPHSRNNWENKKLQQYLFALHHKLLQLLKTELNTAFEKLYVILTCTLRSTDSTQKGNKFKSVAPTMNNYSGSPP